MTQMLISGPDVQVTTELIEWCDRCGAAAKAHVELTSEGTLAFCGHHANCYADRILEIAATVVLEEGFAWHGVPA
jgi:hypothetical protein